MRADVRAVPVQFMRKENRFGLLLAQDAGDDGHRGRPQLADRWPGWQTRDIFQSAGGGRQKSKPRKPAGALQLFEPFGAPFRFAAQRHGDIDARSIRTRATSATPVRRRWIHHPDAAKKASPCGASAAASRGAAGAMPPSRAIRPFAGDSREFRDEVVIRVHPPFTAWHSRRSTFAANTKSLSVRPSILCVHNTNFTLPHAR